MRFPHALGWCSDADCGNIFRRAKGLKKGYGMFKKSWRVPISEAMNRSDLVIKHISISFYRQKAVYITIEKAVWNGDFLEMILRKWGSVGFSLRHQRHECAG
jgi:hypothetical protein